MLLAGKGEPWKDYVKIIGLVFSGEVEGAILEYIIGSGFITLLMDAAVLFVFCPPLYI